MSIKKIFRVLLILILFSIGKLVVKAYNYDFKAGIYRVDGKNIVTDSTNQPFFFSAVSTFEIVYMEYLGPNETVWVEYIQGTIIDESWINGKYTFRAYDEYGDVRTSYIYYDTVKPIGRIYSLNEEFVNGSLVDREYIYFESTDELSGLDMVYVKKPNSSKYVEYTNNTYLYDPGTYYFYSIDYAGNVSITYNVTLNKAPSVDIIYNEIDNSVYLTWIRTDYSVFVNELAYIKEKVFYKEGVYEILVIDGYGRRWNETFIIEHKYQFVEEILPTCSKEGYNLYECISCNAEKEIVTKNKLSHDYVLKDIMPTCIEYGYTLKKCNNCEYEERLQTYTPLGHAFEEEEILATCTTDGGLVKKCLNCEYLEYLERKEATGHCYQSVLIKISNCFEEGLREYACQKCMNKYQEVIPKKDHYYILISENTFLEEGIRIKEITKKCYICGEMKKEYLNKELESNNELREIFESNSSTIIIIMISFSSIWSLYMGIKYVISKKRNDVVIAKKYIKNYILGLVVIFCLIMIAPILIDGIKALL